VTFSILPLARNLAGSRHTNTAAESVAKPHTMVLSLETVVHISMPPNEANVVHDAAAE